MNAKSATADVLKANVCPRSPLVLTRRHSNIRPSATSSAAPVVMSPLSPSSGSPMCAAAMTPAIEPAVLAA